MQPLYIYHSRKGPVVIALDGNGRYAVIIDDQAADAFINTPQQAAQAVADGSCYAPGALLCTSMLGVSADLSKWEALH